MRFYKLQVYGADRIRVTIRFKFRFWPFSFEETSYYINRNGMSDHELVSKAHRKGQDVIREKEAGAKARESLKKMAKERGSELDRLINP